ncbi:peptidylprolyl isomerase [Nitrospira sp. Kam-Ns4a]
MAVRFPVPWLRLDDRPSAGVRLAVACSLALGLAACTPAAEEPPVVAFVNGKAITQSELEQRWAELPEPMQAYYRNEGGKRKFLDDLITRELLLQEARKMGLDQGLQLRERLERIKEQLVLDQLMKVVVTPQVDVSKEEMEAYYASHADELAAAEQIRASHILVPTAKQAWDLKRQLDEGADFAKLAKRYSVDAATREQGGDLGPYRKGAVLPEVEAAILKLKPGAVSEPVQSLAGFHLVKVTAREEDHATRVTALRERLRKELYAEKRRQRFEEYLAALRAAATIRMAEASRSLPRDAGPQPGPTP